MADQTSRSTNVEETKQEAVKAGTPATSDGQAAESKPADAKPDEVKTEAAKPQEEAKPEEQKQDDQSAAGEQASGNPPPADGENTSTKPASPPPPASRLPSKKVLIITGLILFFFILTLVGFMSTPNSQNKATVTNQTTTEDGEPTPEESGGTATPDIVSENPQEFSKLFVYGSWSGQTSHIKAVDLSTKKTTALATLPSSIKKVSILSPEKILYIDKTDRRDHGKQLVIYNIKKKSPQTSIVASTGYGIDDYVLSPDNNYIAIWEVSFASNSEVLQGGKSRVYAVDLRRPSVKNLLYDEKVTPDIPVHYPRAILNNGRVFADKFLPNDPKGGAGWAYGLSVVEFDGTNKQDLQQMPHGSYGTQPVLSPDGKNLVFSGYDGSKGDGKASHGGYRQAILTPNTVEILDTQTYNRKRLPNLDNANIYSSSSWDISNGKIIITSIAKDVSKSGVYSYDLTTLQSVKIKLPATEKTTYGFLSELSDNTTIIGTQDTNASNLGNLGDHYAFPFTQLLLYEVSSSKVNFVPLEDTFAQYITLLPGNYFNKVLGIQAHAQAPGESEPKPTFIDLYSNQNEAKANQQLHTFMVKYDLSAIRLNQQSTPLSFTPGSSVTDISIPNIPPGFKQNKNSPKCEDLAETQCSEMQGSPASPGDDPNFESCVKTNKLENLTGAKFEGKCHDSPLYLYGIEGQQVKVNIQTPISNAIPSGNGTYNITLGDEGKFYVNGKPYTKIAYDYVSNLKRVTPPKRGAIVSKKGVEGILRTYAAKLGLNEKETADLVNAGKQKVTAEYAFVSFFDHETSARILPISFNPRPDNYLNVVFYFKNLHEKPLYTPLPPVFPAPVQRTGFTAVEVSEMVE